ncbi:MAG: class II fumarate hydratase [Magnetospirillum sp.]|nr:class II fumarate hydratase [Magnetospirillum sp.]
MSETRLEHDALGPIAVAADRLWGAQTQRSLENFPIGDQRMPAALIHALALVKKAAALANGELGALDPGRAAAIAAAADAVLAGGLDDQFPLVPWQTGSGTQTNMNLNEVLAHLAARQLGVAVHPNDDVNKSQSSNDAFPTAMHVAALTESQARLLPALDRLADSLRAKAAGFAAVVKIGRTHLQDATPLTLGAEIGAWASQVEAAAARIRQVQAELHPLAQGGTAVGSGLNAPPGFDRAFCDQLVRLTGLPFHPARDKYAAIAAHDALVAMAGALNTAAAALMKVAGDVRLLASGPRCGLAELILPANEPGSSIMPGKVNPTQAEALAMVCCQVIGNAVAVSLAGSQGQLQLNAMKPVMIVNVLSSLRLLADAADSFRLRCIDGLEADRTRLKDLSERSLMLVTALVPLIGYDRAAAVAHKAHAEGLTLKQAALALGAVSEEDFERVVRAERMV